MKSVQRIAKEHIPGAEFGAGEMMTGSDVGVLELGKDRGAFGIALITP